nr:10002_t:CDS:2 [Entrophospora candida]
MVSKTSKIIKSRRKWKRSYSSLLPLTKSQDVGAGVLATEKVKSFDQEDELDSMHEYQFTET